MVTKHWNLIVIVALLNIVSPRRFGGGRVGVFRSSRTSAVSRNFRASNFRSWSSAQKARAAAFGYIFVAQRMRMRYGAGRDWDEEPTVCRNEEDFGEFNGSTSVFGWFLCPTDDVSSSHSYCCGSAGEQVCCDFWASRQTAVIIGVSVPAAVLLFFLCRCASKYGTKLSAAVCKVRVRPAATAKEEDLPPPYSAVVGTTEPPPPPYSSISKLPAVSS